MPCYYIVGRYSLNPFLNITLYMYVFYHTISAHPFFINPFINITYFCEHALYPIIFIIKEYRDNMKL